MLVVTFIYANINVMTARSRFKFGFYHMRYLLYDFLSILNSRYFKIFSRHKLAIKVFEARSECFGQRERIFLAS